DTVLCHTWLVPSLPLTRGHKEKKTAKPIDSMSPRIAFENTTGIAPSSGGAFLRSTYMIFDSSERKRLLDPKSSTCLNLPAPLQSSLPDSGELEGTSELLEGVRKRAMCFFRERRTG